MQIRLSALLACLVVLACGPVWALAGPPTAADMAWARDMLRTRRVRVGRRAAAAPSVAAMPDGTVIRSIYNDCPAYLDTTYIYGSRRFYLNGGAVGLPADTCDHIRPVGVAYRAQTSSAITKARG